MSDDRSLYTPLFGVISVAHLLLAVPILSQFPVIAARVATLGGDEVRIGEAMAAAFLGGLLARPIVGPLMDRFGRRPIFLVGGAVAAAGFPAYLWIEQASDLSLIVIRALHGAGMGSLFPALFTIAADISPLGRRTEGLAVFGAVGLVGLAIGPSFGEALVESTSFAHWCWIAGGATAVGSLIAFACPETLVRDESGDRPSLMFSWLEAYGWRPLIGVWLTTVLWGTVLCAYLSFLEPLVSARGLPGVRWFFVPYGVVAVALRLGLGSLPDRVGPARMLVPSLLFQLPGLALLAVAQTPWTLAVAGLFCGVGHGYAFPILTALVVERAPVGRVGVGVNAFTIAIDFGQLIAGPVAGYIAREAGYDALFTTAGGMLIASCAAFRLLDGRLAPPRPAPTRP